MMKKKRNRPIGLIKTTKFSPHDTTLFKLIGVNNQTSRVWEEEEVSDLDRAKKLADQKATADICYYVYDGSNRILYTSKEE